MSTLALAMVTRVLSGAATWVEVTFDSRSSEIGFGAGLFGQAEKHDVHAGQKCNGVVGAAYKHTTVASTTTL